MDDLQFNPLRTRNTATAATAIEVQPTSPIGMALPPLKHVEQKRSDPFKERILKAQEILFKEFELYSQSMMSDTSSSNHSHDHHRGQQSRLSNQEEAYDNGDDRTVRLDDGVSDDADTVQSALMLQGTVRHLLERALYRRTMMRLQNSKVILASITQSIPARESHRAVLHRRQRSAAASIQRYFRGYRDRKALSETRVASERALQEQLQREREEYERQRTEKRVLKVQSSIRTVLSRDDFQERVEAEVAAIAIQRKFRAYAQTRKHQQEQQQDTSGVDVVQAIAAASDAAGAAAVLEEQEESNDHSSSCHENHNHTVSEEDATRAAHRIQKEWRRAIASKKFKALQAQAEEQMKQQADNELLHYMATKIQAAYRAYRTKRKILELKRQYEAEMRKRAAQEAILLESYFESLDDFE